jgi:gamma-glutamylcyclotransferase (GGCT)/AIG2-like uncharacterized protein YtfP
LSDNESQKKIETENSEPSSTEHGEDKGSVRVFVYGSLKQGCSNSVLMDRIGATWLGYDSITGDYRMMSFGGFPGVVRVNAADLTPATVYGELYMTDERGLAALDLLESHPSFYERRKYVTDILDKRAWMYTLPSSEGYLNPQSYDQLPVDGCIWRPTQDEVDFWSEQEEAINYG